MRYQIAYQIPYAASNMEQIQPNHQFFSFGYPTPLDSRKARICMLYILYNHFEDIVKDAVDEYNNAHPSDKVYFFKLPSTSPYGYGQGSHPNQAGHEAAGKALAEYIKTNVLK